MSTIGKEPIKVHSRHVVRKLGKIVPTTRLTSTCYTCGVKGHTYHDFWYYNYWDEYDCSYDTFMPLKNSKKKKAYQRNTKNFEKVIEKKLEQKLYVEKLFLI